MGSDAKNSVSDGSMQIVKAGEVIDATQLTGDELIVETGGRTESTVVTEAGWLKVATGGTAKCTQYGNNGTLSVNDGAIATDIVQSKGGAISLSTLATVNGRHPESEFSVDQGYACSLLLESGGNLRVLERHHAKEIILDREGGLLVNGTTSAVMVDEDGELLIYPGGKASNCKINQGSVFMLVGRASDTLLAGGTMSNLGGEDSGTVVESGSIYCLKTDGLQPYGSGKTQNLSVNADDRTEVHAGALEDAVIQGGTVILLSPTSVGENFVVEEDRAPVELTRSVALLDGASVIIGYSTDPQQSAITVQQGDVLILDGSTVRDDGITFIVSNVSLNGGKLWLITSAAAHVQLKVKRLHEEGAICLQTGAKEISSNFINVKGEIIGDIHVEIADTSRQTLYNALRLQPDEDGIGATLQPT